MDRWRSKGLAMTLLALSVTLQSHAQRDTIEDSRRTAIVQSVERVAPAVVTVHVLDIQYERVVDPFIDDFFRSFSFFRPPTRIRERPVRAIGSGFVINREGYIITNYHVVQGVSQIQVTMADRKTVTARLVAHDPKTDLAIIKISAEHKLPVISIGTSSDLMPGEPVVAVGNAYGYEHTVTRGIISALHRTVPINDEQKYHDLIQTDASINPGNSGGPLMNIDGEMIALNVAVRIGAQGIGFAIPIDETMQAAAKLLSTQRLEGFSHGVIGETLTSQKPSKFVVRSVIKDSAAEKSGLQSGDIISKVGETVVERSLDFERALLGHPSGEEIKIQVQRSGEPISISFVINRNSASSTVTNDRVWRELGLKLAPITPQAFRSYHSRYRGGLKVTAVRPDS
ncbi:MAG: trypsin-like peptidase domain-containing protein, partial [Candidatus Hydrogenedentes bacterium]|nr:trypsin-like peptidase domain-containing protein [Candidatus Hydrogenedentota bacterium]